MIGPTPGRGRGPVHRGAATGRATRALAPARTRRAARTAALNRTARCHPVVAILVTG